jgi:L,D-peptidoglycan transpeptidase YkuD (ErfK/YbiS/YcfS/YnhG family)
VAAFIRAHFILGGACICQLLAACAALPPRAPEQSPLMPSVRQVVIVRTPEWNSITGTLHRYRRDSSGDQWRPDDAPIPVVVGRNGLAWGIGLNTQPADSDAPGKAEGDGKAPAGAFAFNSAFGYPPSGSVPWIRMPYVRAEQTYKCVDDVRSRHYNTLVFADQIDSDWNSSEDMLREDELYRLGLVVEHNWAPRTQHGRGSCIFLHIWQGPDRGTAGCTAMAGPDIEKLLSWLDPTMCPVLIQLPEPEYLRLRYSWGLP